ncbi:HAD family hydrolase [Jatrophihabitans lederbergiae]|uniref:HAD family hydrolase n=1 Tax=Jatrophihabitans lederbergiae TaxID=3075547 RepID=UPI0037BE9B48
MSSPRADVSAGKPAPDGYLLAAQRWGVPIAECVVVEDSLNGIEAGRTAGRFCSASVTTRWSPTPRRSC